MSDFPTLEGSYRIALDWEIVLPGEFQRRFEEGALVLWRPGLTARISVSGNAHDEPKETRLRRIEEGRPGPALDVITESNGALLRHAYRLVEPPDASAPAFHGFVVGNSGHVHMAVRLSNESDLEVARRMWRGLREVDSAPAGGCG